MRKFIIVLIVLVIGCGALVLYYLRDCKKGKYIDKDIGGEKYIEKDIGKGRRRMKSVLISIQPKRCNLIAEGRKMLELRKTVPNLPLPFKCYIYMTKGVFPDRLSDNMRVHNNGGGYVIGEFVCDAILSHCEMANADLAEIGSCVRREKIREYAGEKEVFGWHISDLIIYDTPKSLSEFYKAGTLNTADWEYQLYDGSGVPSRSNYASYLFTRVLRKPPQSWCYVEG